MLTLKAKPAVTIVEVCLKSLTDPTQLAQGGNNKSIPTRLISLGKV